VPLANKAGELAAGKTARVAWPTMKKNGSRSGRVSVVFVVGVLVAVTGDVAFGQRTLEPLGPDYPSGTRDADVPAWAMERFPAERPEFGMSVGYANLDLDGSSVLNSESALRIEGWFSFSPLTEPLPQLRLGADVGVSMVLDNSSRTIISSDGNLIYRGSSDIPFWTIEPELQLSWRQTIGRDGFYLEPGVAGGWAFGFLQLDGDSTVSGDSYDESDSSVYGRVFLRAGTAVRGGIAGFEASWMVSSDEMDFGGDATGKLGQWYVGFYGALLF
jgi:hypothetical protein